MEDLEFIKQTDTARREIVAGTWAGAIRTAAAFLKELANGEPLGLQYVEALAVPIPYALQSKHLTPTRARGAPAMSCNLPVTPSTKRPAHNVAGQPSDQHPAPPWDGVNYYPGITRVK